MHNEIRSFTCPQPIQRTSFLSSHPAAAATCTSEVSLHQDFKYLENPEKCSDQVGFGSMTSNRKCKSCHMLHTHSRIETEQRNCWDLWQSNWHKTCAFSELRKRKAERLSLLVTVFSMFIFAPENAKMLIQLLVFNAVCSKGTGTILQLFWNFGFF